MPTILIIFGLRFFFYSNEHEPIHVHIVSGDGRAKIRLEPSVELVENNGIKQRDLRRAIMICNEYREDFIDKWHEYFS